MRTKYLWYFCFLILSVSCDSSEDRFITGKWQLQKVSYPDAGLLNIGNIFYNFDQSVFRLQVVDQNFLKDSRFGVYEINGDSLIMTFPDPAYQQPDTIRKYYGWGQLHKKFRIDDLNPSHLRLSFNDSVYYFRKF